MVGVGVDPADVEAVGFVAPRDALGVEPPEEPPPRVIPAPNRGPLLLELGEAPRAVDNGIAYCLAAGLPGSK